MCALSSKADDFDVRYRDSGSSKSQDQSPKADYGLGYDAEGWDTQGFRKPSSKADDFDVRYRDSGSSKSQDQSPKADYGLGYDAEGWDTQGFRNPQSQSSIGRSRRYQEQTVPPVRISRKRQEQPIWPWMLLGVSLFLLLVSGYALYRSIQINGADGSSSASRGVNALLTSFGTIGSGLGGLGTVIGVIFNIMESRKKG